VMQNEICGACDENISLDVTIYKCSTCMFYMCETCFINEENHEHPLVEMTEQKEEILLYSYTDPTSGNKLFLGQLPTALPNSQTIQENDIKSVLSVIDLDDNDPQIKSNRNKTILRGVYYNNLPIAGSKTSLFQGILYHHINLSDFANPDLVFDKHYSLPHLFAESISFIDSVLNTGNVLIHCERGQYRSPTVLVAWLISRGKSTNDAINIIGEDYEGWSDKFRKNRPLWITKLLLFEKKKNTILSYWRKKHQQTIISWEEQDRSIGSTHQVPKVSIRKIENSDELEEPILKKK